MFVSTTPDPVGAQRMSAAETAKLTARVTWLSVSVGLSLALLKAAVWWRSGSVSLLASAADSGLDFVAALGTFWAVRVAVLPADAEHRYGHGKAEAFASLLQAGLVFASAALIAREAITHLLRPQPVQDQGGAIIVMIVSVAATLALVRAQASVIAQTRSVAIKGDRAHYVADLVSNAAAIVGIGLARLSGEARWDALAGVLVAGWLIKGAINVLREASNELLDREVDEADRHQILKLALDDQQVLGVHQFRTRASGPFLHIQMHMELEPDQSLAAAHEIVEAAEHRILAAFPSADLVIHADPFGLSEHHDRDFDGLSVGRYAKNFRNSV
ncbi:cation diffusion facilitator family transporter [Sphingomonas sp. A2-49]|jgi:ferrous-iron efflux pump FieF|uniref:cation diffusion facilitator family transporter n=1 Tax=Sphingomonas sp. A2-49 TaxID=1391375 RepID=UPI0021CE16E5|nr:cation diffusion facilitator family transporter [Sphingomonas sp. A2-49]MCU6453386.1 cation diffusion facilitator family transporter [Sphingomonas sp. A2-49]